MLYETDQGLVVVDYKTDRAPGEGELDAALQRYTPQGATYALAVEEALGRNVERCVFVFVEPGRARERQISDLPSAIANVRESVGGAASPGASQVRGQAQLHLPGLTEE